MSLGRGTWWWRPAARRSRSDGLDDLRRALWVHDTDVPCGAHPADELAAMIGEQQLSYRSIPRVA
jgi:hypothetical protein